MDRRGPREASVAWGTLLAVVVALIVLAMALTGAQRSRLLSLERRADDDRAVVGEVATGLAIDLDRGLAVLAETARSATPAGAISARAVTVAAGEVPGASSLDVVPADAAGPETNPVLGGDDRAEVAGLLARARDADEVLLGPLTSFGEGYRTVLVAPVYQREIGAPRPASTVARRAQLVGWVVAVVDLGELLAARLPADAVGAVTEGEVTVHTSTTPPATALPTQLVDLGGRHLIVRAGNPAGVGFAPATVGLLIAGPALAAIAGAAVLFAVRRLRGHRAAADQRAEQVQLIGDVAPLVQQSLELAEVLPAVAVQLSDHFGLAGVAVSSGTTHAGQVELFALGETPRRDATPVLRPPERLDAGDTLVLALQRGGRSVALLHLVAGRDLDEADLQSLRAISELVTAAIVNASLYASQQEALRGMRELDALKTVFLGTASHELRTPATAISGFASLLTTSWDRFDEGQRRDFVERIAANARSLSAVVQDLLDFSLLDRGTVSVTIEPIDLGALVTSVVGRLAPMFTDHEIAVSVAPAPEVAADVNGLERIVTNLLTNAVKFSPAGTTVTVAVGPTGGGYGAEVSVSDQGPGIPPEEREQVFTRFYRGAGDAVVQTRGVGIGLSVVAELVARLRGDVQIDDAPGGGARFTVRLPTSSAQLLAKEAAHAPSA
jgi:signal transduction histidine kinase